MERIGRFEIQEEIARGSMGVVYRALDPVDGGSVAIKLVQGGQESPARVARFEREARALVQLEHPNVVGVRDVGCHGTHPYLAMELVSGSSLQARLDRSGPLPVAEAVLLVRAVAGAVAHMHGHGVLHRDLKPDNVLLAGDRPLLSDFGLALELASDATRLTQTGALVGTPGYLAPEQARGDRAAIGVATDLYGLGGLLYACLTGVAPNHGTSIQEVIDRTLSGNVVAPRKLRAAVDAGLERVILRALAFDPQDRHAHASEFVQDLDRWTASAGDRGRPRAWVTIALGVALAAVLGGLALVRTQRDPAQPPAASSDPVARPPADPPEPDRPAGVAAEQVVNRLDESGLPGWSAGLLGGQRLRLTGAFSDGPGYLTYSGKDLVVAGGALVSASSPTSMPEPPGIDGVLIGRGPIRVWDPVTGRERLRLDTGAGRFERLAASRDGTRLAIAGTQSLQIWETRTWRRLATLQHPDGPRYCRNLAFSPNGKLLAVTGWDRANPAPIQVWDLEREAVTYTLPGPASYCAFRNDEQLVVGGRWNSKLALWDLASGQRRFEGKNGSMLDLVVVDDGAVALATAWTEKQLVVWDLEAGRIARTIDCPVAPVAIMPGPGGRALVASGLSEVMEIDWRAGELVRVGARERGSCFAAERLPDGQVVTTGSVARLRRVGLDLAPNPWPGEAMHGESVLATSLTHGRLALTRRGFWSWEKDLGALVSAFPSTAGVMATSPDGAFAALVFRDQAVTFSFKARILTGTCGRRPNELVAVAVASGARSVVASSGTKKNHIPRRLFHVWNDSSALNQAGPSARGARWVELKDGDARQDARVLCFSPDGTRAFSGHDDGAVRAWDVFEDTLLRRFEPLPTRLDASAEAEALEPPGVMALVATARVLLAGDREGRVRRWDLANGRALPTLLSPQAALDPVVCLLPLSEDANTILVCHELGALRLWDAAGQRVLETLTLDGDFARAAALSPDGHTALLGTQRGHLIEFAAD